jgi:hypothetical protein
VGAAISVVTIALDRVFGYQPLQALGRQRRGARLSCESPVGPVPRDVASSPTLVRVSPREEGAGTQFQGTGAFGLYPDAKELTSLQQDDGTHRSDLCDWGRPGGTSEARTCFSSFAPGKLTGVLDVARMGNFVTCAGSGIEASVSSS